jgi:hypothetical protein
VACGAGGTGVGDLLLSRGFHGRVFQSGCVLLFVVPRLLGGWIFFTLRAFHSLPVIFGVTLGV